MNDSPTRPPGLLRVAVSDTPLRAEHARLLDRLLQRGDLSPERCDDDVLGPGHRPDAVEIARRSWRERMYHEHQSSAVFSGLLAQLIEAEATLDVKTCVVRSAMDELRHAGLCGQVVELLGGEASYEGDLHIEPLPDHPGCTARERALRNLTFASCFSETVSVGLLTEERGRVEQPFVERVLRQLASDEILHARIGWIHLEITLPLLDAPARERFVAWLSPGLAHLETCMLGAMPLPSRPLDEGLVRAAHRLGFSESERARSLFYDTVEAVIVPRLEQLGLPAERAWQDREAGRRLIV